LQTINFRPVNTNMKIYICYIIVISRTFKSYNTINELLKHKRASELSNRETEVEEEVTYF